MMGSTGGMMGGCLSGMGAMLAFAGAFWAAVVAALVYAVRHARSGRPLTAGVVPDAPGDAALATLRDRFARGEIDRAEYDDRRRTLASDETRWP